MRPLASLLSATLLGLLAACGATAAARERGPLPTPLVVVDRAGESYDLDALLAGGRPLTLVFWQSWCESCLAEAPQVAAAARELEGHVAFVGVVPGPDAVVDQAAVDAAIERFGLPAPQVRDHDLVLTRGFGVDGTPTVLVLGRRREELYRGHELPPDWSAWLE